MADTRTVDDHEDTGAGDGGSEQGPSHEAAEGTRRVPWRGVSLVISVLVVIAAVIAALLPSHPPSIYASDWGTAEVDTPETSRVAAVTTGPEGYLGVGHRAPDGDRKATLWRSKDGRTWHPETVAEEDGRDVALTDITTGQNLMLAAGQDGDRTAIWVSRDEGKKWERVSHDPDVFLPGELTGVASLGQQGWLAVGTRTEGDRTLGMVLRSPDGFVWEVLEPASAGNVTREAFSTVMGGGQGAVIGGTSEDEGGDGDLTVHTPFWSSTDGRTVHQLPEAPDIFGPGTVIRDIGAWSQNLVAVADVDDVTGSHVVAYRSLDGGKEWHASEPFPAEGPARVVGVTFTPDDTLLAVGSVGEGDEERLAMWLSHDAVTWEPVEDPVITDATGVRPTAMTAQGSQVVVLGVRDEGDVARTVAFVHGKPPSS